MANTQHVDTGWTTHPAGQEQAETKRKFDGTYPRQLVRISARFRDGYVLTKRRPFGGERYGWQLTWETAQGQSQRHCGWAHTEASAKKCLARVQRTLWSGDHDVKTEIVPVIVGVLKAAKDGHDRYLRVQYAPEDAGPLWAKACRKGCRFLILAETAKFYTISILGDEYRVSKKELTIAGPWKGSPVFEKRFKG